MTTKARTPALLVASMFLLSCRYAIGADNLERQQKVLNMISEFANNFCTEVPLEESGSKAHLTGKGKAELNNLIKRLADLGGEISLAYQSEEHKGLLHGQLVDALKDNLRCREKVLDTLKSLLNVQASPPVAWNKYVCTTALASSQQGKRALLIEFGVHNTPTNGFWGLVEFATPYTSVNSWTGTPLRIDRQQTAPGLYMVTKEKWIHYPTSLMYQEQFSSPSITPQQSYYLYFEAAKPLEPKNIVFIEDYLSAADPTRMRTLASQVGECPRYEHSR